jgi:hypothetical protein
MTITARRTATVRIAPLNPSANLRDRYARLFERRVKSCQLPGSERAYVAFDRGLGVGCFRWKDPRGLNEWRERSWKVFRYKSPEVVDVTEDICALYESIIAVRFHDVRILLLLDGERPRVALCDGIGPVPPRAINISESIALGEGDQLAVGAALPDWGGWVSVSTHRVMERYHALTEAYEPLALGEEYDVVGTEGVWCRDGWHVTSATSVAKTHEREPQGRSWRYAIAFYDEDIVGYQGGPITEASVTRFQVTDLIREGTREGAREVLRCRAQAQFWAGAPNSPVHRARFAGVGLGERAFVAWSPLNDRRRQGFPIPRGVFPRRDKDGGALRWKADGAAGWRRRVWTDIPEPVFIEDITDQVRAVIEHELPFATGEERLALDISGDAPLLVLRPLAELPVMAVDLTPSVITGDQFPPWGPLYPELRRRSA